MLHEYKSTSLQKRITENERKTDNSLQISSLSLSPSLSLVHIHLLDKWYCQDDGEFLKE